MSFTRVLSYICCYGKAVKGFSALLFASLTMKLYLFLLVTIVMTHPYRSSTCDIWVDIYGQDPPDKYRDSILS
jgi:hypothetical protein